MPMLWSAATPIAQAHCEVQPDDLVVGDQRSLGEPACPRRADALGLPKGTERLAPGIRVAVGAAVHRVLDGDEEPFSVGL
jgi:hypothetical protein